MAFFKSKVKIFNCLKIITLKASVLIFSFAQSVIDKTCLVELLLGIVPPTLKFILFHRNVKRHILNTHLSILPYTAHNYILMRRSHVNIKIVQLVHEYNIQPFIIKVSKTSSGNDFSKLK